jgi:hypothetical protein
MAKTLLLHYLMALKPEDQFPEFKLNELVLAVASGNFVNECDINAYAARLDDFTSRCLISAYKLYVAERFDAPDNNDY